MTQIDIRIPKIGESIQEAYLAQWYKKEGDQVKKDMPVLSLETDKISLDINAESDGVLHILVAEEETVPIGTVVARIDSSAVIQGQKTLEEKNTTAPDVNSKMKKKSKKHPPERAVRENLSNQTKFQLPETARHFYGPAVRHLAQSLQIDLSKIAGTGPGNRITKGDILLYHEHRQQAVIVHSAQPAQSTQAENTKNTTSPTPLTNMQETVRKTMTPIRKKIAERLVKAKNSTAMLTTFNEIDMTKVIEIRKLYKESFLKKYEIPLGFMSFFIKATIEALKEYPRLNAFIDGDDIIYHNYYNIGVAIGSERGLIVPVIRSADQLSFAQIELVIKEYVKKIQLNQLSLTDLEGGTFTLSNGGIYGSLLSTPILNTPQSGILGMHAIQQRPMAIQGEIVIRPMMYVAMSYDHRVVDGRESVNFLKRIKECIENPERIMMEI